MLGNRRYCYPLTITDFASRYLLTCKVLSTTQETFAFTCVKPTARISDLALPLARPGRDARPTWHSGLAAWFGVTRSPALVRPGRRRTAWPGALAEAADVTSTAGLSC